MPLLSFPKRLFWNSRTLRPERKEDFLHRVGNRLNSHLTWMCQSRKIPTEGLIHTFPPLRVLTNNSLHYSPSIQKEGREEGRKAGRQAGRKGERQKGRKAGRKEGRKEGRVGGRTDDPFFCVKLSMVFVAMRACENLLSLFT